MHKPDYDGSVDKAKSKTLIMNCCGVISDIVRGTLSPDSCMHQIPYVKSISGALYSRSHCLIL